jgi:hypothetical protein
MSFAGAADTGSRRLLRSGPTADQSGFVSGTVAAKAPERRAEGTDTCTDFPFGGCFRDADAGPLLKPARRHACFHLPHEPTRLAVSDRYTQALSASRQDTIKIANRGAGDGG